jgi:CHAT domain-containing protein
MKNKRQRITNKWFEPQGRSRSLIRYRLLLLGLVCLTTLLCILALPALPKSPNAPSQPALLSRQNPDRQPSILMQKGKALYDAGQFAEAISVLQQAIQAYQAQDDFLRQAIAFSNLSLAYQQLGQLIEAERAIANSLDLLNSFQQAKESLPFVAQALEIQGGVQLDRGQPEQASSTWQRAEAIYQQIGDRAGITRSRINQAKAWQVLGFYRRALSLLNALPQTMLALPNTLTKAIELRSLGDTLRVVGELERAQKVLQQSLAIAERLRSPQEIGAALFSLGNTARAQQDLEGAIAFYQKAANLTPVSNLKIQADIERFSLLVKIGPSAAAQALFPEIQLQLNSLPPNQAGIYARIRLAQSLMKWATHEIPADRSLTTLTARLLTAAVQQAQTLQDRRATAYAIGTLGSLYEKTQQWSQAQELTQQAIAIAQTINAPDIAYRWNWQLGRLLKQQGDFEEAIVAYDAAISALKAIRSDLVAVNRDIQFSFKESVEPVYREAVALLVRDPSEPNLDRARQHLEALQLAELDDYFQEACLKAKTVLLDQLVDRDNPTAAIIYPIILPKQLEVIVKIPHQPLQHHSISKTKEEVEGLLERLQQNLTELDATDKIRSLSQEVYGWLVQPIESRLEQSKVDTLVFVLDGALRSIPMAALYDGKQYLVEKYAIALSLGLQLLEPKSLDTKQLNILAAGLVEPPANFQQFPPLPDVQSEFNLIAQSGFPVQQLLNQEFTSRTLEQKMSSGEFNVIHLATHGQFRSHARDTFILAADGPINLTQLDSLLRGRNPTGIGAIDLLVLSACQTAEGDERAILGLAGMAVKAGTRSTVASLWHIDDHSTAILMGEFYRELASAKVTKAEALRRAQMTLLKNYPNYSRPAYWAAYVTVGNWF